MKTTPAPANIDLGATSTPNLARLLFGVPAHVLPSTEQLRQAAAERIRLARRDG